MISCEIRLDEFRLRLVLKIEKDSEHTSVRSDLSLRSLKASSHEYCLEEL